MTASFGRHLRSRRIGRIANWSLRMGTTRNRWSIIYTPSLRTTTPDHSRTDPCLLTGWCSWYHYYEKITAANLRSNVTNVEQLQKQIPTNVVVVDVGYMTAWGNWHSLKPNKFPAGLCKRFGRRRYSFEFRSTGRSTLKYSTN